ncbi:uncharacterized protein [Argopecten irradians]|uniref:uncharacterized protein n=1 Tax=Argopecten irradians TaxID=31199 RepID=UPI0037116374
MKNFFLYSGLCTALDGTTCVSPGTTNQEGCKVYLCDLVNDTLTYGIDPASSQCTAMDGTTCVALGSTNQEGCDIYRCEFVDDNLDYVIDELRCRHPNGTCLPEGYEERNKKTCIFTSCIKQTEMDESITMRVRHRPYGCLHSNGTCLEENYIEWNIRTCDLITCRKEADPNGMLRMNLRIRQHGCMLPSGSCLAPNIPLYKDLERCCSPVCRRSLGGFILKRNYQGCPRNGKCELVDTVVDVGCMRYICKVSNFGSTMQWKPIDCDLGDGTCHRREDTVRNETSCLEKVCRPFKADNGTFVTKTVEIYYGCPHNGGCEEDQSTILDTQTCTTKQCRLYNRGRKMAWIPIQQGCVVEGECKNDTNVWHENTEFMCVEKRCNVEGNKNGGFKWDTEIVHQGCRYNDTCYYNGDTWMEESCFTKNCTVSETTNGGSVRTDTVSGVCKAADGSCVPYGGDVIQEDGAMCVCSQTVSPSGYLIGQTTCPVPAK